MKILHVYPTSRAIRAQIENRRLDQGWLPVWMRIDEFEQRCVTVPDRQLVDPLLRVLLLQEASRRSANDSLKLNRELVRFFTKSDVLFRFYEELAQEQVSFEKLVQADAYAEFGEHIEALERLWEHYRAILDERGYTDRACLPQAYRLNEGFLGQLERIELFLEGYLSRFEMQLLLEIAALTPLWIHFESGRFTEKMQQRFLEWGIKIPSDSRVVLDVHHKRLLKVRPHDAKICVSVLSTEERLEQVGVALEKIEEMVRHGIAPASIVVVVPDESMVQSMALFDHHHNLNFAMGFDYTLEPQYRCLEGLQKYWRTHEEKVLQMLLCCGLEQKALREIQPHHITTITGFFECLEGLYGPDLKATEHDMRRQAVDEIRAHLVKVFEGVALSLREWLFLWMKALSKMRIDDVRGGKVTVMGVLETRGMQYDGVVILDCNEAYVPTPSRKDQFLNTQVRAFAGLPTTQDREALQKQYYRRLIERAKSCTILYTTSDNLLPSTLIYELGAQSGEMAMSRNDLLYASPPILERHDDPVVESFDARTIVWSASQLKCYLTCKRQYYYRYIIKIPPRKQQEVVAGTVVHEALRGLFSQKSHFLSQEALGAALDAAITLAYPPRDALARYHAALWREKLRGFVVSQVKHFDAGWQVVACEEKVKGEINGLRFEGRIDRRDSNGTQTRIIDYKTGSIRDAQKSKSLADLKDFQMSIYHALLCDSCADLSLHFVKVFEEGKSEPIVMLEEKNILLNEHLNALKQTRTLVAQRCENLSLCTHCDYQLLCERGDYL
jgi:ATP-dependent helicase/nuclease subunit B